MDGCLSQRRLANSRRTFNIKVLTRDEGEHKRLLELGLADDASI